jgi:hypothetical protein
MNREHVAQRVESLSMASGIMAGLAAAAAYWLEPSGLDAVGIWLGIQDEPWIIAIEPILGAVATFFGVLSGCTYFWAKTHKPKQSRVDTAK